MSLLEVKNLSIGYPSKDQNKVIQSEISVSLESGQIVSLMGQNGVGKTTFIKTISGLLNPIKGEILFDGRPLEQLSAADMSKKLSVVLTEKPYAQNLSVLELIAIGRHPYSSWMSMLSAHDKEVIDWAITETHINYLANKKLFELSDGQLQKVMIARALAQETNIILLDEPAAHLDLYNKIEVMMLLRQIAQSGKAILISTHDMQVSTQLSDRLWLFNFNEAVKQGTPEDLIMDGTLEKTLYLNGYGYDMVHGTVDMIKTGRTVSINGSGDRLFWTQQALRRNGYTVQEKSEVAVIISDSAWEVNVGEQTFHVESIENLLLKLNNILSS